MSLPKTIDIHNIFTLRRRLPFVFFSFELGRLRLGLHRAPILGDALRSKRLGVLGHPHGQQKTRRRLHITLCDCSAPAVLRLLFRISGQLAQHIAHIVVDDTHRLAANTEGGVLYFLNGPDVLFEIGSAAERAAQTLWAFGN